MATQRRHSAVAVLAATLVAAVLIAAAPAIARAQKNGDNPSAAPAGASPAGEKAELSAGDKLAMEQQRIGDQFKHVEEVLLRMAEIVAPTDPRRAALLRKAVAQSKERLIGVQFDTLVDLIKKDQLARTISNQQDLDRDLRALLEMLLSENRAKQLESEKARIREYIKRLTELIKQQKAVQGQTGGADDPRRLAGEQGRLADRAGRLSKDVKSNEEQNRGAGGQQGDSQGKPKEGEQPKPGAENKDPRKPDQPESDQPKPDEKRSGDRDRQGQGQGKEQGQGQGEKGQGQGEKGQPQKDRKPGQTPSQGQPPGKRAGEDQPPPDGQNPSPQPDGQNPARQRLDAAQQRMREAQKKLEEAQRKGALDKQEDAIRELEQAKAHLEEILRQLREEEMERTLVMLEARFLKMLQMQRAVHEGTQRLDKVPQTERNHNHEIEAGRLSSRESEIVLEADKAMMVLRDDGTAVAFPEALAQARQDMQQVVDRLARAKVDQITQGLEQDIITALEEMLQAFQQARKKLEDKRQRPPSSQGQSQTPSLVDTLAELRMIRTLQVRVRDRTNRYSKLIEGDQAQNADLVESLRQLGERQRQIHRITRDLDMGKNR